MNKQEYILQTSKDGIKWQHKATFLEGEMSRFDLPFDANVAVMEMNQFKAFWAHQKIYWKYIRIIINYTVDP